MEIYSVAKVAEIVGKTPQAIRLWCRNREIARDGRKYLITREVLEEICSYYKVSFPNDLESDSFPIGEEKAKESTLESGAESDHTELLIQILREQIEEKDRQIRELEDSNKTLAKNIEDLIASTKALSANAAMTTAAEKKDLLLVPSNAVVQEEEQRTDLVIVPKSEITHIEPEERPKLTRWERLKRAWKGEPWT